jgi:outer membrane lipase/esterase
MHWIPTNMARLMASATAALLVSACGGGGSDTATKVPFTALVSFGDSLSDVGTYKVGTIAAAGGGKWTVNSSTTDPINWTELLAGQLSVAAPCAARTGMLPSAALVTAGFVSIPMANTTTCTNYAQGGSRVSVVYGSEQSTALQAFGISTLGMETLPVVTQMANHTALHGNYTGKELVTVMVGGNDVLMNLGGVSKAAAGGSTAAAYAVFAGWSTTVQAAVAAGGASAVSAASTAAVTSMATAATELAAAIKTQLIAKGATRVVVANIPNMVKTPTGQSQAASTQLLIDAMVTTFNSTLASALSGTGVVIADVYTQSGLQYDNPSQYGITNVTTPACSATGNILSAVTAITCTTSNTLASGATDVSTYFYADGVHPTPAGYKLLNRFVALQLSKAGWL